MLPQVIQDLAEKFRKFPGIGFRSSQKLALDVLQLSEQDYEDFLEALNQTRNQVKFCNICGFFSQEDTCSICQNISRSDYQICLVESPTDIITLEKSNVYYGKYHVLERLISPLDNIFPQDTNLESLIEERLPNLIAQENTQHYLQKGEKIELIFFFKAGFSAEATASYIRERVSQSFFQKYIQITQLAQGLPLYFNPDTLDQATIAKAILDRREIS